jgi:site-specific DNA recombinase
VEMKRAVIYVRVSSEKQAGPERVSIEVQEADCRKLCEERGYQIVELIRDTGAYRSKGKIVQPSGARADRPGFQRLLSMARAGEIDVIVAWREDRLYRGVHPLHFFAEVMEERPDLEVALVREGFDRKMMMVKAGLANWERESIIERTVTARQESLRRGRLPGGDQLLFGYRRAEGNKPEIVEDEAALVVEMFRWYVAGVTLAEIRQRCDRSGVHPRKNKRWAHAQVCNILYRPEVYSSGTVMTRLAGETHVLEYPKVISPDLYALVLQRREENKKYRGHKHGEHHILLKGLITCACGWRMTAWFDRRWPNNAHYRCQRKGSGFPVDPRCPGRMPIRDLDRWAWAQVEKLLLDPDRLHKLALEEMQRLRESAGEAEKKLGRADEKAEQLENERAWVISQARVQLLSSDELEHQLAEVTLQQAQVEKEREELRLQRGIAQGTLSGADAAIEAISKEVETHWLLSSDLDKTEGDAIPLSLAGSPLEMRDGAAVSLSVSNFANMLGCEPDIESIRRAQYQRRCELLRRFVKGVRVYLDDGGEKQAEIELVIPLSLGLPSMTVMPRGTNPAVWWRK